MASRESHALQGLSRALSTARADVKRARHGPRTPGIPAAVAEQRRLLAALESFTEALDHQGSPVPYQLHSELAMYRAMFNIRRTR